MMLSIPEIIALDAHNGMVRVPSGVDIPLTPRVKRLIDTESFRRLSRITQVGLVSFVYPAARHTRFEHSLGVYRLALLFLKRLAHVPRFAEMMRTADATHEAELFIVSALLHDIGHWPFCHLIEDLHLDDVPEHEILATKILVSEEIASLLRAGWKIEPLEVADFLAQRMRDNPIRSFLSSILSGPIDIDKMDYLFRDSLHAGVLYGQNVDQNRLIGSLCVNEAGTGLAITEKGKTAAELMIFARYVMFSEVYWHHTVRAATAMLQRLFIETYRSKNIELASVFRSTEEEFIAHLKQITAGQSTQVLFEGLFGAKRRIYKRVAEFSILEQPTLYRLLAGKSHEKLMTLSDYLCKNILHIPRLALLIDAPPVVKEMEIKIEVCYSKEHDPKDHCYRALENVSPVVRAMAREHFDDYTKRVRIFAHPDWANTLRADSHFLPHFETACQDMFK